ncbi:S26 family signal peptidase [Rhizobium sp. P44RR-XXIV]|uniref:S26 family signal peptidase n=1 Tax=Rhizobium sp. P44RR-XXIV TaxID=1921145 RepID=UPI000986288C|nr:S26 family signal peptidase [Rhizobium sp. P44RR-XXIV]TIX93093.1 S26 family signal peptidase [Rhizobium sp. P44RR-XXIV]
MTRFASVMLLSSAAIGVAACLLPQSSTLFIWNASASVPIGLYRVTSERRFSVADLVAMMPPAPLADFMVQHGYIARGVPLLKRIAALPGQQVCRIGSAVTVDGTPLGDALDRDRRGRQLPVWHGCRRVADDEIFLMNCSVQDSFDGRYFGPVAAQSVVGRATPIYTDENGNGRFVWAFGGAPIAD